jgi:predicted PhzF superfamily epimerase YddE/YHI9
MQLRVLQIDAFADAVFGGNPAAVVPLETWLPEATLRAIAAENNLSETAFFVARGGGSYDLRWLTPAVEVDLCGHATLATGYALLEVLGAPGDAVRFETKSGPLRVCRRGSRFAVDLPCRPPSPCTPPPGLARALGRAPREVLVARDYVAVFDSEAAVRALEPDFGALARDVDRMVIVTAPGDEVDFVSRFFAPAEGVNEDPVTGSAHCTLTPLWAERLGRPTLRARQVSRRGGALDCALLGERVELIGGAALYLDGRIHLPPTALA